ncbi:hypothetical protein AB0I84_30465, partial [Streptomyces spectabilis]|uniref:hypothetical protein n=1 Tax=Streptomyces spectabilis TaxID=68270 RepID=UPI0033CD7701
ELTPDDISDVLLVGGGTLTRRSTSPTATRRRPTASGSATWAESRPGGASPDERAGQVTVSSMVTLPSVAARV